MQDNRKNTTSGLALGAAAVWFGSHCGSGFCTGALTLEYFSQYGWAGVLTSVIPFLFLFVFAYLMGEYSRRIQAKSYKDMVASIYTSNKAVSSVLVAIWDILAILVVFVSVGSCLAAAGSMLNSAFGISYTAGTILTALIVVAINGFGTKALAKISKPLVYVMIACIVIICISILGSKWDSLADIMKSKETFSGSTKEGLGKALLQSFNYISLQSSFCCGAWIPLMGVMSARNQVRGASAIGALLNGIMLVLVSVTIVSQMPDIQNDALPIYSSILTYYGKGSALLMVYQIALFLAILTTATASTFNATARWSEVIFTSRLNKEQKLGKNAVSILISLLLLLVTIFIAQFGLRAIISKGYTLVATLKAPLALSAGFIFAPLRLWQMKKGKHQDLSRE